MNTLLKYLLLVLLMIFLVGCVPPDPMRAAIAQERANNAAVAANNSAAQIERAQQSDTDARRAQENIQALQAQQAIVQAQAVAAQAQSQTDIAASNNLALVQIAAQVAEASGPDYTPLYVLFAAMAVVVVLVVVIVARMNVAMAQASAQPQWRALPNRSPARVLPPPRVQAEAEKRGAMAIWDPDGAYWTLVNEETGQTWTQRKRITSN